MLQPSNVIPTVTIATVLAVIGLTYTYYRRKRNSIPKEWTPVGKVKQLFVYPLKSGRRREVQNAKCTILGASMEEKNVELRDRSFVVYGESNNEFKTARTYPNLTLIETAVGDDGEVIFTAPEQNRLSVKFPNPNDKRLSVTLFTNEPCDALDCGNEAAAWISQYLLSKPSGLRLAYHMGEFKRDIMRYHHKFSGVHKTLGNESAGLYQDLTSYLLINHASIEALNTNLDEKVSANNFRPNILVEGKDLPAFAEEDWDWIKIGDVVFRNVKPCTRCIFTTINPEVGIMSKKREPLKTLENMNTLKKTAHIKCEGKKGVMGIHLGAKIEGEINIGDIVCVG